MKKTAGENIQDVHIFGEKFPEKSDRHFFPDGGGLFLLTAGVILILNNMNVIPWQFWDFIWIFWPVLLILAGVKIILGRNFISNLISFLITLFLIGFIVTYGLIQVNSPLVNGIPENFRIFVITYTGGLK